MSPTSPTCTHDLGPGITVCLRCRQEERQRTRARQQRLLGLGAAGVIALSLVGLVATNALQGRMNEARAVARTADVVDSAAAVRQQGASAAAALPRFVAPAGRTALAEGIVVERQGDSAVVSFDAPMTRTRRTSKFEHVVRITLPVLVGPAADSLLATPEGSLVRGDLLGEVAPRGLRLPLRDATLRIALHTRAGQDGPLVIGYAARVTPR